MQDVIITALLAAVTAAAGLFLLLAKRGRGEMTGKQQRMMARIFLSALLLFVLQLLPAARPSGVCKTVKSLTKTF